MYQTIQHKCLRCLQPDAVGNTTIVMTSSTQYDSKPHHVTLLSRTCLLLLAVSSFHMSSQEGYERVCLTRRDIDHWFLSYIRRTSQCELTRPFNQIVSSLSLPTYSSLWHTLSFPLSLFILSCVHTTRQLVRTLLTDSALRFTLR